MLSSRVSAAEPGEGGSLQPVLTAKPLRTCSVDLSRQRLQGFYTDQFGERFGSVERLVMWLSKQHRRLDCAVNGGIFGTDQAPLGLFVASGVLLHPLNTERDHPGNFFLQPNGALVVEGARAEIRTTEDLSKHLPSSFSGIDVAVQSGPMLLHAGVISSRLQSSSDSLFTRNAVCTVGPQHLILVYAARPVSLYQFASDLQAIGCRDALYLDGHLSQMYPFEEDLSPAQRQALSTIIGITSRTE